MLCLLSSQAIVYLTAMLVTFATDLFTSASFSIELSIGAVSMRVAAAAAAAGAKEEEAGRPSCCATSSAGPSASSLLTRIAAQLPPTTFVIDHWQV